MNGREAKRIAQLDLGDGKLESIVLGQPDDLKAQEQLADEVGHVAGRRAPAHGGEPFPMDGPVDERAEPQEARQVRVLLRDLLERRVRDGCNPAWAQGQHAVVHCLQQEAVKVHEVAGHVDGGDLAATACHDPVAGREALQKKAALDRAGALPDDVLVGSHLANPRDGAFQHPLLLRRELIALFELQNERVRHPEADSEG